MIIKLLTEHHLEFLSLKGGCRGSSESTLVRMTNCWKSHATAQIILPVFVTDLCQTHWSEIVGQGHSAYSISISEDNFYANFGTHSYHCCREMYKDLFQS